MILLILMRERAPMFCFTHFGIGWPRRPRTHPQEFTGHGGWTRLHQNGQRNWGKEIVLLMAFAFGRFFFLDFTHEAHGLQYEIPLPRRRMDWERMLG